MINNAFSLFYFIKTGLAQNIIHNIKYKGDKQAAFNLGVMLGNKILLRHPAPLPWELMVPVPLHPGKFEKRGYNQSEVFGQGLSAALGIPMASNVLRRKTTGKSQASRSKDDRFASIFQAFELVNPTPIQNRHVLLIDDVLTTGATLESCGQLLLQNGAAKLSLGLMAVTVNR